MDRDQWEIGERPVVGTAGLAFEAPAPCLESSVAQNREDAKPLCPGCIAMCATAGTSFPHAPTCERIVEPMSREEVLESLSSPGRTPESVD